MAAGAELGAEPPLLVERTARAELQRVGGWLRLAHGLGFVLLASWTAFTLLVHALPPALLLLLALPRRAHPLFRRLADSVGALWFGLACLLWEGSAGVRVRITTAAPLPPGERAFIIANHASHLDWYPVLCLLARGSQVSGKGGDGFVSGGLAEPDARGWQPV